MREPPKVKICGITRLEDAELSVELGAWALGMIFFPDSPRRCSPAEAERIAAALRRKVELCGVFVNAPLEQVVARSEALELSLLQFSGDEGPAFCAEAARRTGARVIKAAQVSLAGDVRDLERFHVDFHLLDARAKEPGRQGLRGGTGETFDWTLVSARRSKVPLILSGGLNAESVGAALELTHPYAVDTASGTEAAPGRKDPRRLREFFAAVARSAEPAEPASATEPEPEPPPAPEPSSASESPSASELPAEPEPAPQSASEPPPAVVGGPA
ncbi:MAG TPA: phosphoribosylanthranilate isomerase [Solirubrobacteraceae bacterium]|jgi:phosphoribosylanthranilate isomerase|nr:phosphoribosylanthranilate isomerase [Solirubrobacteraceae bacterium]